MGEYSRSAALFSPATAYLFSANSNLSISLIEVLALLCISLVLAWSWWSFMVSQWRMWAYARVEDLSSLERSAIAAGLIWPTGHFFERTEFRSKATDAKLRDLVSLRR